MNKSLSFSAGSAGCPTAIETIADAKTAVSFAWPLIVDECRSVLGGELHYQAVVYYCLRAAGIPRTQLGMNVKQWITDPVTLEFRQRESRKHHEYQGGFEPIPDAVIFGPRIAADWRRRNCEATLLHMLMAIEVKASERTKSRLGLTEISRDIKKLAAHREEVRHRGSEMSPLMMVIDTAPLEDERMTSSLLAEVKLTAEAQGVGFCYLSPGIDILALSP